MTEKEKKKYRPTANVLLSRMLIGACLLYIAYQMRGVFSEVSGAMLILYASALFAFAGIGLYLIINAVICILNSDYKNQQAKESDTEKES